jgi:hypothetical protein
MAMLGCLEVLLTAGEIILRILVIIFIPIFLCGTLRAVASGATDDPCVLGLIIFYGFLILVAGRRALG